MNDVRDSGFKSYIRDENELESISLNDNQRTRMLDGETLVCEAQKVMMYTPLSDKKKATLGILTVTTFKLSFACTKDDSSLETCCQQNFLLGPNDVCLSSIDYIYQTGDRTKKRLLQGQSITGKVKELLIVCKNMRVFEFSFKHADKDSGKMVANAIIHHAFPKQHTLLFAYDFKEPSCSAMLLKEVHLYYKKEDWKRELERTRCLNWRLSVVNHSYATSPSLPETMIVPQSVTDNILSRAVEHFQNRFCPIWVYGTPRGAALVRMSDILPTITDRTQENTLLEHVRRSHPDKKAPYLFDLNKECPTPKDVQISYLKLRELCTPDSTRIFKNQDFKFYGLLDNTKWLLYVSTCLTKAVEAAEKMHDEVCTVVLQEGSGQDINCVVSSLTQLILDPFFRTRFGFQSLVQKDWVALGHPFANRLGHILTKDIEPSPLFLLFLDCVWQLLQQYPKAFQISETYLTTLWDSAHMSVFDTFLFNCEYERRKAEEGNQIFGYSPLVLRSVWDWNEQFNEKDIALFNNPLYDNAFYEILKPKTWVSCMDIWTQCYFRWLPELEIINGGRPQIDLCSRYIVSEIRRLQKFTNGMINGSKLDCNREENLDLLRKINGFYPFSHGSRDDYGLLPINNVLLTGDTIDSQSILNLNLE